MKEWILEVLKYAPKVYAHFVKSSNIFDNINLMDVNEHVMDSNSQADNFQPVSVTKSVKFPMKKEKESFDVFRKTHFLPIKLV